MKLLMQIVNNYKNESTVEMVQPSNEVQELALEYFLNLSREPLN